MTAVPMVQLGGIEEVTTTVLVLHPGGAFRRLHAEEEGKEQRDRDYYSPTRLGATASTIDSFRREAG